MDSSGVAVAQAPGSTFIVAHVGEKSARVAAGGGTAHGATRDRGQYGDGRRRLHAAASRRGRSMRAATWRPAVPVTWVSSDTSVIVVNDSGVVTGVGAGEADVTVMHAGVLATVHAIGVAGAGAAAVARRQRAVGRCRYAASPPRCGCCSSRGAAGRWLASACISCAERGGTADPAYATTNAEGVATQQRGRSGRCRAGSGCSRRAPSSTARRCCWPTRSRLRPTPG